jgi:fatty acid desaturase
MLSALAFLAQAGSEGPTEEEIQQMLTAMAGVWLVLVILGAVLVFVFWGMIFSRAGYSFAMALLMFIPLVNFIWLLIFAFSRWPVQRELDHYRRMGPPPQAYPPRY